MLKNSLEGRPGRAELYLQVAKVMFATIDRNANTTLINPKGCEILGYEAEEVIGKNWFDLFIPKRIRGEVGNVFVQLMAGKIEPVEHFVNPLVTKSGEERLISFHNTVIRNDKGEIEEILFSGEDITERLRAEEEIAREREQLAVTLRSIGDGVITTDTDGRVVLVNKVAERLSGWRQEEAANRPLQEVFHIVNERTQEPCASPVERVLLDGRVVGLANHTVLISKDGRQIPIADSGAPIRDRQSRVVGVVLVFRDVTAERLIEQELLKVHKLESVGILAGGIAHDFNNLLAAILGTLSLALDILPEESKPRELVEVAKKAALRATALTQQLLTFSKGGEPVRTTASIEEVIRDSASFVLRGSPVGCTYAIAEDLALVEIDTGQISQVIQNLVLNALHAMPEGGTITIRGGNVANGKREYPTLHSAPYIKLTLADEGKGIPEADLDRIFDPYFTTKEGGSGLGLAITHSIIVKHDGHISVASEPGEGTIFTLYLPASDRTPVATKGETAAAHPEGGRARVLVMDDDTMVLKTTMQMLTHTGYAVEGARDGEEAIDRYREAREAGNPFGVVIVDLTVPGGMGGQETATRIHAIDPQAKLVVSSGYSNDPVLSHHRDHGFIAALQKPYLIEELRAVLRNAVS